MTAEKSEPQEERALSRLVEAITDYAIFMLDPDGFIVTWNTGAERIKGYNRSEIIGAHFSRFFTEEDKVRGLPAQALAAARREGRFETEGWRVRRDGSRFLAFAVLDAIKDDKGEVIGFAKITRDVTERHESQQALLESERRFRLLVEGVTDYAIYMLDPSGVVVNWNSGAQRIKGYAANEVVGRHFSAFFPHEDRIAGLPTRILETALREGRFEAEARRIRKDGSKFWAHVVIDPIRDDAGELIGFAKITRDISDRKEAEAALQAAQTQLAQAQKMEALGQLTGGVAHDFNNLLMIVNGQAQLLKRRLKDNPEAERQIEAILIASKRGADLTRQLLTFARRQPSNPQTFVFAEREDALQTLLTNALRENVRFSLLTPPGLWPLWVDPSEFELALLNLVVNARDAMPDGGEVSVLAENVRFPRGVLRDDLEGEFVAITVADTGHGIPADIMPKVFDPFFTTKSSEKGSGLGLAQVFGFVRHSGGDIKIRSEVGRGTHVSIYLPRAAAAAAALREHAGTRGVEQADESGCVLLVEDNPEVLQVTRAFLEQLGYRVRPCANADEALAALREGAECDVVLSDIVMAGSMNGLALAHAIRDLKPCLPILLATGYSSAVDAGEEFPTLRKPYQIGDLGRAISSALAKAAETLPAPNVVRLRKREAE